jgi:hypothetical protein
MNVIFGKENAELLREKYLLLDLETFDVNGRLLECFCLVETEKISADEYPQLEHYKKLHQAFVDNFKSKNYKICHDLAPHLLGKFGGQLDTFYEIISEKIKNKDH